MRLQTLPFAPTLHLPQSTQGQALPSHVMEQLAGPVVLPSHYLREAVAGLRDNLAQYAACAAELEQVLGAAAQQQEAGVLYKGVRGMQGLKVCWDVSWVVACEIVQSRQ